MVRDSQDFLDILDSFYDQLSDAGALMFPGCYEAINEAAKRIMQEADMHYVPGHKVTELMADIVNIAAAISAEGWLNEEQATGNFRELTEIGSPLARSFIAESKMEKARYEPIMLSESYQSPRSERNAILRIRLKRMLEARQSYMPLPSSYTRTIRTAANRALQAECFANYRPGPMLQFFDEMVRMADQITEQTFDELEGVSMLSSVLEEKGRLWKQFQLKAPRFKAKPGDPLHENLFPQTRAQMLYIPDLPGRPTLH